MHWLFTICNNNAAVLEQSPSQEFFSAAIRQFSELTDYRACAKHVEVTCYLQTSSPETTVRAVFRTFLRTLDGYVLPETNTVTADRAVAEAAFAELVNRVYLDGENWAAVLCYNDSHIAFHRFDCSSGDADYWRDRLPDIRWPSVRVGRPKRMEGGRRINIYLDAVSLEAADRLGDGNISEGIRLALAALRTEKAT